MPTADAYKRVQEYFPKLTQEDLASRNKSDARSKWENCVRFAKQALKKRRELKSTRWGHWEITDKGRSRVRNEWSSWRPRYRGQALGQSKNKELPTLGQGFETDSGLRERIEDYAMKRAKHYFSGEDYEVIDVSRNNPFDLICIKGARELHVEVKGTKTRGEKILLTAREVAYAKKNTDKMALFVLRDVKVTGLSVSEGRVELIHPWKIGDDGKLEPLEFTYSLKKNRASHHSLPSTV